MSNLDAVTEWMAKLGDRDCQAAQVVWDNYFQRLANFARRKLRDMPQRVADEEDVALMQCTVSVAERPTVGFPNSAIATICGESWSRSPPAKFTPNRASNTLRNGVAEMSAVSRSSCVLTVTSNWESIKCWGASPTPELANMVVEDYQRLLNALSDDTLRRVTLLKLEGYTSEEIAQKLNCVTALSNANWSEFANSGRRSWQRE